MNQNYIPAKLKNFISVDQLYSLHYFAYLKNFSFEGESHDFWELIFCDSGKVRILDQDKEFILSQGQAFLHCPNHFHNVQPDKTETNVIVTGFDGNLEPLRKSAGRPLILDQTAKQFLRIILSESRKAFSSPLNRVYQYELKLRSDAPPSSVQLIRNCLENLLLTICNSVEYTEILPSKAYNTVAQQLISFLQDNVDKQLTMQTISYRFGYSPAWLQHIFRAETGCSIMQFFIALKIDKAKKLISDSDYSIANIADMLGYDTPQYFSKQFRQITNMTPSAYADSVKETGILE